MKNLFDFLGQIALELWGQIALELWGQIALQKVIKFCFENTNQQLASHELYKFGSSVHFRHILSVHFRHILSVHFRHMYRLGTSFKNRTYDLHLLVLHTLLGQNGGVRVAISPVPSWANWSTLSWSPSKIMRWNIFFMSQIVRQHWPLRSWHNNIKLNP